MKLNKEQFSKTVLDVVGPLIDRIHEQMAENQKNHAEQQAEWFAKIQEAQNANVSKAERIDRNTLKAARFLRLLALGRGDPMHAARIAEKDWGDSVMAKVMGESTLAGGGALVPEELAADVIELLRNRTVVRKAGAQTVPMNHGTLTLPFLSSGSTAYYKGESEATTESTPQVGQLVLTARDLSVLVATSNQLLRDASSRVDQLVRDDMIETARVREDLAFLRGTGLENTPRGLTDWAATTTNANATANVANVTADLGGCMQRMEDDNVPLTRLAWITSPTVKWGLKNARVTQGTKAWPELEQGNLLGVPLYSTAQIPANLGGSADESELILVDMAQILIAESDQMELSMSDSASYTTGGSLVSAFARGETVMKLDMRHDLGARFRGTEIQVLDQVDWDIITAS